jgi:hypothetical protein
LTCWWVLTHLLLVSLRAAEAGPRRCVRPRHRPRVWPRLTPEPSTARRRRSGAVRRGRRTRTLRRARRTRRRHRWHLFSPRANTTSFGRANAPAVCRLGTSKSAAAITPVSAVYAYGNPESAYASGRNSRRRAERFRVLLPQTPQLEHSELCGGTRYGEAHTRTMAAITGDGHIMCPTIRRPTTSARAPDRSSPARRTTPGPRGRSSRRSRDSPARADGVSNDDGERSART